MTDFTFYLSSALIGGGLILALWMVYSIGKYVGREDEKIVGDRIKRERKNDG